MNGIYCEYCGEVPSARNRVDSVERVTVCDSQSKEGWLCTRIAGHTGNHVACGIEHDLADWSDTAAAIKQQGESI